MRKINPQKNISEQVVDRLLQQILDGKWPAGTQIPSETELTRILGVSRLSIREAVQKLTALDLLVKRRGEGTFVNEISEGILMNPLLANLILGRVELTEISEFRKITELGMVDTVFEHITGEDIFQLEELCEKMVQSKGNPLDFSMYDLEFHLVLAQVTRNSVVIKVAGVLKNIYSLIMYNDAARYMDFDNAIEYHRRLLESIRNKDKASAEQVIKEKYSVVIYRWQNK